MDLVPQVVAIMNDEGAVQFPGGVYDRPVARTGRANTPAAFDGDEIIPCASVTANLTDDPTGHSTVSSIVTIWLRAPNSDPGRATLRDNRTWVIDTFRGRRLAGDNGTGAVLTPTDGILTVVDPVNDGAVLTTIRLQAAGLWG